jgi:uncharacterized protein YlxW (UPF0749 family)
MGESYLYEEMLLGLIVTLFLLLIIAAIVISLQLSKMKKRYRQMLGATGVNNLEEVMISVQAAIGKLQAGQEAQDHQVKAIYNQLKTMKSRIGIHRYNAFNERGNDLSFSLAITDEQGSGLVLSGIHARDETYIYAKPLDQGNSKYSLSPEEKQAINQALQTEQR